MKNPDYIAGLDGLRAMAIALVLLSHTVIYDEFSRFDRVGLNAGYAGVGLFFVLSGYLITRLLLREEREAGSISMPRFYIRRALRLFPALWIYLAVVFGLWLVGFIPENSWQSFVTSLAYIRNLAGHGHETEHLWSLAVEEQFYIVWPVLLVLLARRDKMRLALAAAGIAAVTAWRFIAAHFGMASAGSLYIRSDFRFDEPLVGSALALLESVVPAAIGVFSRTSARRLVTAAAASAGLCLWLMLKGTDASALDTGIIAVIGAGLVVSRGLSWRPAVALGRVSYGVYLWQQLFFGPKVAGFAHIRTFPLGLLLTLAAAVASYFLIERPFLRLKDRRFHRLTMRTAAAGAM